jgi:hypothetical protein
MWTRIITSVALLVTLVGCASPLDPQLKSSVRTISIEPLQLADKPVVATPGAGIAALLTGGLGLAAHLSASDIPTVYKSIVERNVDVAAEIRRTAKIELERKGYRVVESGQSSDAKLTIIGNYGIGLISLTGDDRAVATTLNVKLVRSSDGNVLWRKAAFGRNADPAQRAKARVAPFDQWFKDDALVAEQHKLVAGFVTAELLEGL